MTSKKPIKKVDVRTLGDLDVEHGEPIAKAKQLLLTEEEQMKKAKALKDIQKLLHLSKTFSDYCKQKTEDSKTDSVYDLHNEINNMRNVKASMSDNNNRILKELSYFKGTLRPYQVTGVSWLKTLFENAINGILADEMGLGKTIQVIALLCYLIEKKVPGPFLIVVPLSTIPNWTSEFKKFAPKIPVVVYHGSFVERITISKNLFNSYLVDGQYVKPVILTTTHVVRNDQKVLNRTEWKYIIIDEAHCIKNPDAHISRDIRNLKSINRLLLTGTPLHNNLTELWALLNFIMPSLFKNMETFSSLFILKDFEDKKKIVKEQESTKIISKMHNVLEPFMLRRLKCEVLPDIVPKKDVLVYCPLSKLQRTLYTYVLRKDIAGLCGKPTDNATVDVNNPRQKRKCTRRTTSYSNFYVTQDDDIDDDEFLNRLFTEEERKENEKILGEKVNEETEQYLYRLTMQNPVVMYKKIVDHPFLVHCPVTPDKKNVVIDERLVYESGKMLVLDALLPKLLAGNHKILLFSTFVMMLDFVEEYMIFRGYNYRRLDGSMKLRDREINIDDFNNDPKIFAFLVSTRAGGLGLNLVGADTVIFYDRDWNPQCDIQAQDRCHRIGQTKPVMVYSLVTKNTIDEKIINVGDMKRRLEKIMIKKGRFRGSRRIADYNIDLAELEKLLESNVSLTHANGFLYTDEEINALLDRRELYKEMETKAQTSDMI